MSQLRKNVKGSPFPNLSLDSLMKKHGAQRVSESARQALRKILEKELLDLTQKASKISQHAGRKTINDSDIKIANQS